MRFEIEIPDGADLDLIRSWADEMSDGPVERSAQVVAQALLAGWPEPPQCLAVLVSSPMGTEIGCTLIEGHKGEHVDTLNGCPIRWAQPEESDDGR